MAMTSIYKTFETKNQILNYYDTLLINWPKPNRQFTLDTTFGYTFIIESGKKGSPVVLLLHGTSSNSAMWIADANQLSYGYHVFAIDLIGECGKSSECRPAFINNNYSNWINEIIEKLELNTVSIIACSLGGWIAIDFTINYPSRVDKLVLLATAGITQVKIKTIFWIFITSMLGNWGFNKLNKMVYGNLNIDKKALGFASMIRTGFIPRKDLLPIINDESLQKIAVPVLFIGGEHDCFYDSQKTASRLKQCLRNVKSMVLKDQGHVLINQTNNILQFLNT